MNRTAPHQNQAYEISAWRHIEILNDFIRGAVLPRLQDMHWNTPPRRKLQQISIRHFEMILCALRLMEAFWLIETSVSECLKELRNRILRTSLVWPLFCLIRLHVGLYFSMSSFRKLFFVFLCFLWIKTLK